MTALVTPQGSIDFQSHAPMSPIATALLVAGATLAKWETRARTRADLRRLDPELYQDIGAGADDIAREAAKPFWRA